MFGLSQEGVEVAAAFSLRPIFIFVKRRFPRACGLSQWLLIVEDIFEAVLW